MSRSTSLHAAQALSLCLALHPAWGAPPADAGTVGDGGARAPAAVAERPSAAVRTRTLGLVEARRATLEGEKGLHALFAAQAAWVAEHDRYLVLAPTLGFAPERGNRYAYYLAESGPIDRRDGRPGRPQAWNIIAVDQEKYPATRTAPTATRTGCPLTLPPGVKEIGVTRLAGPLGDGRSAEIFVALAVAPLPGSRVDCWTVASVDRVDPRGGAVVPRGLPFHEKAGSPELLDSRLVRALQDLEALASVVARGEVPAALADPWGLRYQWGPVPEGGFWVASCGPDGEAGTPDDLGVELDAAGRLR